MKLRYQMRGLGIGMIVTALLMGLTAEKVPLSDAEIRTRAAELGMVEGNALKLTDIQSTPLPRENPSVEESEMPDSAGTGEGASDPEELAEGEIESDSGSTNTDGVESISAEEASQESESGQTQPSEAGEITITVEPGTTSYRVCIMLEEAGVVEDAAEFDTYLCNNGYSRKVDSGTYEIPVGADWEEIAKIITRNR